MKIKIIFHVNRFGSLYDVSVKLPTYPSPEPTVTLKSHFGQNVGFREG